MGRVVLAAERRLAEVVASGSMAATLSASPRVYEVWARRIGAEVARLGVVGSLTGLVNLLRSVEDGTCEGGERLLDMGDALRGLLDRLVAWEEVSERLPPPVVIAAQGCLSALQPSLVPNRVFAPVGVAADGADPGGAPEPSCDRGQTLEMGRVLEQLRHRCRAEAVLVLDRHGQVLATSTPEDIALEETAGHGPLATGALGRLSPEMLAALPRVEWMHRFGFEGSRQVLVSSLGGDATLVVVGDANTFFGGFSEPDTKSALDSLVRRIQERIDGLETQRVVGFVPEDMEDPFR